MVNVGIIKAVVIPAVAVVNARRPSRKKSAVFSMRLTPDMLKNRWQRSETTLNLLSLQICSAF